ncbi:hypothetical protein ACOMHN_035700 [Nucella lapillus]
MCPFSHGMLLALVIYLQFLKGEGATISSVHASDQKITTFQSTQLLFYPPRQMMMERKHVDQMSDRQLTEKVEHTKRFRQANGGRGTVSVLESNRSEQKINASTLDSDVNKDMYVGLDGKLVNVTIFVAILKEKEFQRQLNRAAQWAYMCLVMLMCLMMWMIWCLGGLERCRYRPDNPIRFTDLQPHVTVNDVLQKRRQYLPMFNEPEWEEVLMCNRGNDP